MNLESGVLQVHIEDIIPNRFQPRLNFNEQGIKELSDSIREHGIIQPLVLRKLGNKYEIIAGERRYKAAQMAGLSTVPAVIANIDDNKSAEVALVENVQRRDLTAIEEARSYQSLLNKGYLTQEQLAKRMGLSQPAIANKLRLLNLDDEVQQALLDEKISERHARTLLTIEDKNQQKEWLHRIINERLTVRQLDLEIKKNKEGFNSNIEDEDAEVPLVEPVPSIENIIANASDLKTSTSKLSLEDLMKPQEIIDENIETLDPNIIQEPSVESFTTATKVPEFNIATPNSASTLISENDISNLNNDSTKFFNFEKAKPIEQTSSQFQTTNFQDDFIDMSKTNDFFRQSTSDNVGEDITSNQNDDITLSNDTFSDFTPNSNNKFFTLNSNENTFKFTEKKETYIDPMDAVNKIASSDKTREDEEGTDLKSAIMSIRKCIENLGEKGFFIDVEEIDFSANYEIKIDIHKDN